MATPVLAQAAIIDAIMGGGGVVGTECVNGVVSPEYQSNDAITEFGPGTTLFVKDVGKTRLRKGSGNWNDGVGYINDDKVVFSLIDGNNTNQRHYLVDGTDQNGLIAEFGDASGGTPSVPDGQGEYTMEFVPATGNSGGIQVLGTIYRATLEDSKWTCVQPDLVAPETPVIQSANPQNNGATLVLSPDADQVIEQYTVQLSKPGTSTEFEVPIAGGGTGTLTVEERSSERTVLSFVGSGITNGQTWTVKVKAENGNGANVSDFSNSVEFIPGADTVNLDFSPQFNAKITRNSAGQACNFDDPDRCFVSESVASQAGRSGKGLPDNGEFAATKDHPALELAPFNSEGNDAWKAKTAGSTPFDVKPAGKYSSIHLVATSGGSAGKKARFRVEMQYDDGTRVTSQEYDVPDWFTSPTAPVYVVKGSMDRYRGDAERIQR